MLKSITGIFTTAAPVGVATRDLTVIIGAMLTLIGVFGFLTPEQVEAIRQEVPGLLAALGAVAMAGTSVYRIVAKSLSDQAAEAAKEMDRKAAQGVSTDVKTPNGAIVASVPAKGA